MEIHNEGRAAFDAGVEATDSPYGSGDHRSLWVKGWYDAQHECCVARARDEGARFAMTHQTHHLGPAAPGRPSVPAVNPARRRPRPGPRAKP